MNPCTIVLSVELTPIQKANKTKYNYPDKNEGGIFNNLDLSKNIQS